MTERMNHGHPGGSTGVPPGPSHSTVFRGGQTSMGAVRSTTVTMNSQLAELAA